MYELLVGQNDSNIDSGNDRGVGSGGNDCGELSMIMMAMIMMRIFLLMPAYTSDFC